MADETVTRPAAPKPAAVDPATAVAIAEAMRQSKVNPFGPPGEAPTQRVRDCAAAIKGGTPVAVAMAKAGYGRKYIEGNAAGFPAFLQTLGLLTPAQARKATGETMAGGGE
jgi:hypothetical protein